MYDDVATPFIALCNGFVQPIVSTPRLMKSDSRKRISSRSAENITREAIRRAVLPDLQIVLLISILRCYLRLTMSIDVINLDS